MNYKWKQRYLNSGGVGAGLKGSRGLVISLVVVEILVNVKDQKIICANGENFIHLMLGGTN